MKNTTTSTTKAHEMSGTFPASRRNEQKTNTSDIAALHRNAAAHDIAGKRTLATDIILHELNDDGSVPGIDDYLKNRGIVHRAMRLLEEWKFIPARISCSTVPVDIIALRKDVALLVQVISSKKPVPDAKTLMRLYAKKVHALRQMGTTAQFRKVLMAYSKLCGWKYYDVLPGGLIPAWDLSDVPATQS